MFGAAALMANMAGAQGVAIGSANGVSPGSTVEVPVTISGGDGSAAGVNLKLQYNDASLKSPVGGVAGTIYNGHTLNQNTPATGQYRSVIYNSAATTAFTSTGLLQNLSVALKSTLPNGHVVALTPLAGSAISNLTGTAVGTLAAFSAGSVTISTPYPTNIDARNTPPAGWLGVNDSGAGQPWLFEDADASHVAPQGMGVRNSGGFRTNGFWLSPEAGYPLYDEKNLLIAEFTVSANTATPVPGALTRFRTVQITPGQGDDQATIDRKVSTLATLSEYGVDRAQPQRDGGAAQHILPTSTPRVYRFPIQTEGTTDQVWPFKRLAWDQIVFEEGVSTNLAYYLQDVKIKRYNLEEVEPLLADIAGGDITTFQPLFQAAPDNLSVGTLFRPDARPFETYRSPFAKLIATNAIGYEYDGSNDMIYSFIDTGEVSGPTLVSRFTGFRVQPNTLYLAEFYVNSSVANAFDAPGQRYRINIWPTGEFWVVTTTSRGNNPTIASNGTDRIVRLWFIPSAEAATADLGQGAHLNLSFDAFNFYIVDNDSRSAGTVSVNRIRFRGVPLSSLTPIEN